MSKSGWLKNMLKLNEDKTEFIIFGTNQQLAKVNNISIKVSSEDIQPIDCVRNLGYFMDKVLRNAIHINQLCKLSYAQLGDILKIRSSLDTITAQVIVQALVLSKLDYCNSLLTGMANYQIQKLLVNPKHGMQNHHQSAKIWPHNKQYETTSLAVGSKNGSNTN